MQQKASKPIIALVQAPAWGVNCPPLHLALLSSFLKYQGYQVFCFDFNIELYCSRSEKYFTKWNTDEPSFWTNPNWVSQYFKDNQSLIQQMINRVLDINPTIIGFSVHFTSDTASVLMAKEIKRQEKDKIIIFGGPQASRDRSGYQLVKEEAIDYVVQGEGEETLLDIVKRIEKEMPIDDCLGVIFSKNGEIKDSGDRELIRDLNSLPFADFSDFDFSKYKESERLPIYMSRGCPNRCVFCNERPYWRIFRFRKAETVFAELKYQMSKIPNIIHIDFHDSLINGKISELERLCDLIIDSGLQLRWSGQVVIRKEMTKDLLDKMARAGCVSLDYGLESVPPQVSKAMGKALARDADVEQIVRNTHNAGIDCIVNFMFGFPGETDEEADENIKFCERNKDFLDMVNPSPGFCAFDKGSYGYDHPDEFDIYLCEGGVHWVSKDGYNNYVTRLHRFEKFCKAIKKLGIRSEYPHETLINRNYLIGDAYIRMGEYRKAIEFLKNSIKYDPIANSEEVRMEILNNLATACRDTDQ